MIDITTEPDIERLRQTALLMAEEIDHLHKRLAELTAELARARGTDRAAELEAELRKLQSQLAERSRMLFGPRSERRPGDEQKPLRKQQKGHGPTRQPKLEERVVEHTFEGEDTKCTRCGGELAPMAWSDDSEEIDVVRRKFVLTRHKRRVYRCRCVSCSHLEQADGPPRLIPGGRYSIDFAVQVAADKYDTHQPLDRQVRRMGSEGLAISSQTLWDLIEALARHLEPTYLALRDAVLAEPVVGADETTWKMLISPKGKGQGGSKKWFAWSLAGEGAIFHHFDPSRSHTVAMELLDGFAGVLMVDGYAGYDAVVARFEEQGRPLRQAFCWAHARRGLLKAEKAHPEVTAVLDLIGELYRIEKACRAEVDELGLTDVIARRAALLDARRRRRDAGSRPVLAAIRARLAEMTALPGSSLEQAIGYIDKRWAGLTLFVDEPAVPIDNNHTERGLRGICLGRRNHHGSRSRRGAEVAALFYSLVESARLWDLDPFAYLSAVAHRAVREPGYALLPSAFSQEMSASAASNSVRQSA